MIFESFAQQGWQCPVCKRVYSPMTPWCYFCGGESKTTTTTDETVTISTTGSTVNIPAPEPDKWGNMNDLVNNFLHEQMSLDSKDEEQGNENI